MRVTFYGVRGSVPTPGPGTVRYGGNTSCVEVRLQDGTVLILDGGTGIRELGRQLVAEKITAPIHLLITHVHWDHILGIPFFAPIYQKDTTLVLHPMVTDTPGDQLFDGKHFPLRLNQLPAKLVRPAQTEGAWQIGSASVTRIHLNHPGGSTGYRIRDDDGATLVFLTDNELSPPGSRLVSSDELARFAQGADLLVHDSQYIDEDMPAKHGWGHSTVAQVLDLGRAAEVKRLALYHHDPEREDSALDAIAHAAEIWWRNNVKAGQALVASESLVLDVKPG
jgi:phosphoribosyl 1,2-cyclic phosphodiesterase